MCVLVSYPKVDCRSSEMGARSSSGDPTGRCSGALEESVGVGVHPVPSHRLSFRSLSIASSLACRILA